MGVIGGEGDIGVGHAVSSTGFGDSAALDTATIADHVADLCQPPRSDEPGAGGKPK